VAQHFCSIDAQLSYGDEADYTNWHPEVFTEGTATDPVLAACSSDWHGTGLAPSGMRCVVPSGTAAGPERHSSMLASAYTHAENGDKQNIHYTDPEVENLSPDHEFDHHTAEYWVEFAWLDTPQTTNTDYGIALRELDKDGNEVYAFGQRGNGGWCWWLEDTRDFGPPVAPGGGDADDVRLWNQSTQAMQPKHLRVWYTASTGANDGTFRVDVWHDGAWLTQVDVTHNSTRKVCQRGPAGGVEKSGVGDYSGVSVTTRVIRLDVKGSAAAPFAFDPADFNIFRKIETTLLDCHEDNDGTLRAGLSVVAPGGEFKHGAAEVRAEIITGAQPDLSDGVAGASSVTLEPESDPAVPAWTDVLLFEHRGASPLARGQTVYYRVRLTIDPNGAADVVDLPIRSFPTPAPKNAPATIKTWATSCCLSTGISHPILAARVAVVRGTTDNHWLGDNGYVAAGQYGRVGGLTSPWGPETATQFLGALRSLGFDRYVSELWGTRPNYFHYSDHCGASCLNNSHRGFRDGTRWERANRPPNSEIVAIQSALAGDWQVGDAMVGSISGRTAWYLGTDGGDVVMTYQEGGGSTSNTEDGEVWTNQRSAATFTAAGNSSGWGWNVAGYPCYRETSAEITRRAVGFYNRYRAKGFLNLGAVEMGYYGDRAAAIAAGHYYRSYESYDTLTLLIDTRMFQEPVPADGETNADRTLLGAQQLAWVIAKLEATEKPYVRVIAEGAIGAIMADDDNAFAHQQLRDELYAAGASMDANGFIVLNHQIEGDRHAHLYDVSIVQVDGMPYGVDVGEWTRWSSKSIGVNSGPGCMASMRRLDQFDFAAAPPVPAGATTGAPVEMRPAGQPAFSALLDPALNDGRGVLQCGTQAWNTDAQTDNPGKFAMGCVVLTNDEAAKTVETLFFNCQPNDQLPGPTVGDAGDDTAYGDNRAYARYVESYAAGDDPDDPDETPPEVGTPVAAAVAGTTLTVAAPTTEAGGTVYAVLTTTSNAPSVAQVKAGDDHTGADAIEPFETRIEHGMVVAHFAGLTDATGHYAHVVHTDAAGNDSLVASSDEITTAAIDPSPGRNRNAFLG